MREFETRFSTALEEPRNSQSVHIDKKREVGIGELVFNKPSKFNMMDDKFFEEYALGLSHLIQDPEIRVILIWAEGSVFTAGLDLKFAATVFSSNESEPTLSTTERNLDLYKKIKTWQEALSLPTTSFKPVVAAIHSKCVGGGVDLISAADIRVCSADAEFSVKETQMAIVADLGTLQRLERIVSKTVARQMVFTGQPIDATTALRAGLVSEVFPDKQRLLEGARHICHKIALNSPLVVQATKKFLNLAETCDILTGLDHVALWNTAFLKSPDLLEAISAFLQKRKPNFKCKL